jgi:hypothetical protein
VVHGTVPQRCARNSRSASTNFARTCAEFIAAIQCDGRGPPPPSHVGHSRIHGAEAAICFTLVIPHAFNQLMGKSVPSFSRKATFPSTSSSSAGHSSGGKLANHLGYISGGSASAAARIASFYPPSASESKVTRPSKPRFRSSPTGE